MEGVTTPIGHNVHKGGSVPGVSDLPLHTYLRYVITVISRNPALG